MALEIETARMEEPMERAALDATWELLSRDAPRIFHVLAGVEDEPPDRSNSSLALGLAEFRAGRYLEASERFREAAAAAPGALRASLLAAACAHQSAKPLEAARALLALDLSRLGPWSELRGFAGRMVSQAFRRMEAEPEGSLPLAEELASHLPPESERPERSARGEWWMGSGESERYPRPEGEALSDPDAWRLWWRTARFDLEGREGRFAWRQEER